MTSGSASDGALRARAALGVVAIDPTAHTVTVRIPFSVRRRGGRKLIAADVANVGTNPLSPEADLSLVTALARAYRWKALLDAGKYGSMTELARAESVDKGYLSRALDLTLLAPDIVEDVLNGTHPEGHNLGKLTAVSRKMCWAQQREDFRKRVIG